jgi:hypothetical protein
VRQGVRIVGWLLLGVAIMSVALVVVIGAALANGSAFDMWVGWATVWALVVAAVGVALVAWDKIAGSLRRHEVSADQAESELAKVALDQAQVTRSQLLGTDEPGDDAANVRFVKGIGRFREVGGATVGDLDSVLEYYQSLSPGRLVLLGRPGAGKTVLALELVVRLLEQRQRDGRGPVPVLISAAAYDTSRPWEEWLSGHLVQRFSMSPVAVGALVQDRRIVPVVDGLDEMDPPDRPERAKAMVAALNSYMRGRERAAVVVTCRSLEYDALGSGLDRATHIEIVPMDGKEAADYLTAQLRDEREKNEWQPLLAELVAHPDGLPASQLSTPWRLTLALTVFRGGEHPVELIPDASFNPGDKKEMSEYVRAVDTLLLGRYVASAVRLHDPSGRYTHRPVHQWLTALAAGLAWQSRHDISATDIELAEWWRPTGSRFIRALHIVLAMIPGIVTIPVAVITMNVLFEVLGGLAIFFALFASESPLPERLNLRRLTSSEGLKNLALGFLVGLLVALACGLIFGLLRRRLVTGLVTGLVSGLILGLILGLTTALRDPSPQAVRPREVIHENGLLGLAIGLSVALAVLLGSAFSTELTGRDNLESGLLGGLLVGLTAAISFGGSSWMRYHIAIVLAARRGNGPLRFGAMLEWAREAGVLREAGIAYQFRHRQLQDWLAPNDLSIAGVTESGHRAPGAVMPEA